MSRPIEEVWDLLNSTGYEFDAVFEYPGDPANYYAFIKPPKMTIVRTINGQVSDAVYEKVKDRVDHEIEEEGQEGG